MVYTAVYVPQMTTKVRLLLTSRFLLRMWAGLQVVLTFLCWVCFYICVHMICSATVDL